MILFLPCQDLRANDFPVFRHISMLEGLPDPAVEAFVQDRYGYVWIGTRAGLARHEGDQLTLMPRIPSEQNALPAQHIVALHAHSDGMVWASVEGYGLVEIGPDLTIRAHLKPAAQGGSLLNSNVRSMVEDCEGQLWMAFAEGGVAVFDPRTASVEHFGQSEEFGLSPHGVQTHLMLDRRCRIWLVQTERIGVLDPATDPTRFQSVFDASRGDSRESFVHGWISEDDKVYVARGRELIRLTVGDGPVENRQVDFVHTTKGFITGIGGFSDGRTFLTTRSGLEVLDRINGQSRLIKPRPDLPDSLPSPSLNGPHLLDAEGGLWLSVNGEGLVYLPPNHAAFARLPDRNINPAIARERIRSISPASDRRSFWVTSATNLFRLDIDSGARTSISDIYPGLFAEDFLRSSARSVVETDAGLLLNTGQSLLILREGADQLEPLVRPQDLAPDQITALYSSVDSRIWIGLRSGELRSIDPVTGTSRRYGPEESPPYHWLESADLHFDSGPEGALWVAGDSAVHRYHQSEGFVPTLEVDVGPIRSLVWDKETLWVGSDFELLRYRWSQGALVLADRHEISAITEHASLLSIIPTSRQDDTLWLILRSGVGNLNLTSGHFKSFSRTDGLAVSEFSPEAIKVLDDGRILLGGKNGLVAIDPQKLRRAPKDPPVHLRAVTAGGRRIPLSPGPRSALNLDWGENSVRFEFSALTYIAPERVQYRVRLNNWDDDWLEIGRQSGLYYSNLRPGRYRFDVQAAGPYGKWGDGGDQLTIHIAPPLWRSSSAWIAYAATAILMLAVVRLQFIQARQRRRELREVQQKRRLAENQRQLIQRLNRDLNPLPLARCVADEIQRLCGAATVILGFRHDLMPNELVSVDHPTDLSREEWWERLEKVDGLKSQAVDLKADDEVIARVLLLAGPSGFKPDYERPLGLLVDLAGQALQNSVLLQQVRLLADQAEHASRAKSEFLATMSHEIRTPLHGLLGMAELLDDESGQQAPHDLINTLKTSGHQLQRILDDVLDISKIEEGRMQLAVEPFETVPLLEQVIDLHAASAARKNLDFRLRISASFPLMTTGDAGRLAQILGNLVNNAIKFTPSGGVELAAEIYRDGRLRFAVSDTGPGIPPDQADRLFQPFSQLDSTHTREHAGSGLGLAISRRLAHGMGGSLSLRRSTLAGSVFELLLPAIATSSPARLTNLLSGVELVALVPAQTYRLLIRAARRWGFDLSRGNRISPHAGAMVLFDGRNPDLAAEAMLWHAQGCKLLELNMPRADSSRIGKVRLTGIRWPLTESRLVAAMLDQVV